MAVSTLSTMSEQRRRVSQFHLRTQVYEGRKCNVYEARYTKVGGVVETACVKVLQDQLACVGDELRLFLEEVHWARGIRHPLFPQVIEAGESEGCYFLAMNYVHGWGLSQLLQAVQEQGIPLPIYVALAIAHRIAKGMHALHEWEGEAGEPSGLVHLGIEPGNIMMRGSGGTCLLDFGSVRRAGDVPQAPEQPGGFHSPELLNGVQCTRQSDVFSLGKVLDLMRASMEQGVFDGDGDELILRACHPSPGARFATMEEFAKAIEDLAESRRLPLSDEVCANFSSIVFESRVVREEPLAQRPKGKSFFHMSSENMKTVLSAPSEQAHEESKQLFEQSPIARKATQEILEDEVIAEEAIVEEAMGVEQGEEEPILLSPKRPSTEVDSMNFVFDDPARSDDSSQIELKSLVPFKEELEGEFEQDTDIVSASERAVREELGRLVSENVVQTTSASGFSDEHQEVTAFMPAEAMAAMASRPIQQKSQVKKREKKAAFPQELIPTRAYDSVLPVVPEKEEEES